MPTIQVCVCGIIVDRSGRHGLSCKSTKGTAPRHQQVNDILKKALGSAQVTAVKEPDGLCRRDGKRPDGLTLFPWARGKCLVWDYTCRDTLAPSHVMKTSKEAGAAAVEAEKIKLDHYQELATSYIVMPVAMETLGSGGPSGLKQGTNNQKVSSFREFPWPHREETLQVSVDQYQVQNA